MRTFLLISFFAFSLTCFSQSTEWTKEDRSSIYDDYLNNLVKYKNLTKEQKESISLCCLDEVTKKYIKTDLQSKIDIELKRIQDAMINQCAKNIGVNLSESSINEDEPKKNQDVKSSYKKEDFDGSWTFEYGVYTFYLIDGEFKYKNPAYTNEARGKWYLDGKSLILDDIKTFLKWGSAKYEIVSVSADEIVLINLNNKNICHLKKNN